MLVAYTAVLGYNSLALEGKFSPDSVFYVDAAQNLASGRGLSTSMRELGPRIGPGATLPRPLTIWAPLYPVLIATAHVVFGMPLAAAALFLPVFFTLLVLVAAWLALRKMYDPGTAMLAVALLAHFFPVRHVATHAWSEATGMAFFFLGLYLLVRWETGRPVSSIRFLLAGLAFGLAIATRYALLPCAALGLIVLLRQRPLKSVRRALALYLGGGALVVGVVFGRSLWLTGHVGGARGKGTGLSIAEGISHMARALRESIGTNGFLSSSVLALCAVVAACAFVLRVYKKRPLESLRRILVKDERVLLVLWPVLYLAFLLYSQTRVHVDPTTVRLVFPATCVFFLLLAATGARMSGLKPVWLSLLAIAVLAVGAAMELPSARASMRTSLPPVYDLSAQLKRSETLTWLSENVSSADLLFAEDGLDVPFYVGPVDTVFFRPQIKPRSRIRYELLEDYLRLTLACERYDRVYLIIGVKDGPADWIIENFGEFTADLVGGRLDGYPGIRVLRELKDGTVYEVDCEVLSSSDQ